MTASPADSLPARPGAELSERDRAVLAAVDAGFDRAVDDLKALVRIPSVSWDAYDAAHVQASAEAVAALAEGTGVFERVSIERAPIGDTDELGQPAVLATRPARAGRPSILLYAHHDVQPWGDEALWRTPPFEPTEIDGRLHGRGASDDKAGVIAHIAAIRALAEVVEPEVGLALFIEGEEEHGSRSFQRFLEQHAEALEADVIVVADSDNWSTEVPSLTVALRGNVALNVRITTLGHASHSGMYGGAVPDAMMAFSKLAATLWHDDGSVAIEGLTEADLDVPEQSEEHLRAEAALLDGVQLVGTGPLLARLWAKPSATITGVDAPSVPDASNTILPTMRFRLSTRIAPGQSAADAFAAIERHLRAHAPFGAHIELDSIDLGDPFLVDASGWGATEAKRAMADAWGAEAVETGIGGSIPFIADLVAQFPGAQILVTGVEDPGTMAHSPNESQHLGVLRRAIGAEALLLARAGDRAE
ncbi:M20/M25/M40 family metallo-hydrolase [Agrococcus sp. BE272]|uniref:M20/M25/M40 family metallo-hydrolase n=1 Tax=Agrococcus sp. BE272 TaxID=2817727 RepID=UPI00285FAAF8|nr:M20/M25/M40 family metallo-hydrolase [Agrococcus sp. BE272]MDR7234907.1 acetylornithine deacetylase/succinyl-diaminopimelate desuccinylase-like protein [Agrococcus sp. BE272]